MSSPLSKAGSNWQAEVSRLRNAGFALPNSPSVARVEARRIAEASGGGSGSMTDIANRKMTADMTRRRLGSLRQGTNLQMALPKMRQPLGSLVDKGIPFNIHDPKELTELRRLCRMYYSTHDLVPLLVDIYSKFPVTGLEFQSKDPLIEKFYTKMFLDDLNYEEFLPDALAREYFVVGEVTTLGHFNESLGVWSSEEILNPDMVAVSKSMFVQQERVQLLVKELVESLRDGPNAGHGMGGQERDSERLERTWEYQQLVKHYPEIIQAAARDDGLDIADALVSRIVNKANPRDLRGTPPLLRSLRTLMMEEELNAAQDAVASRMYAPMILCTMGLESMGGGANDEPWIPGQAELDDLRADMESALAADFKLLVHNLGVKVESVFGRESVPNFDSDYDRIDAKLMQAWGIGQALVMGGTGAAGTYASTAINREICEQLMFGFQKRVIRHMRKRMEIIAEAQEHYDYELKGGLRVPIYREIEEEDPLTGEKRIVRVPKLLIPDIHFATLNLRDEATERQFYLSLKEAGIPLSDKFLALNVKIDFEQELEREQQETIDKALAKSVAWKKVQDECDEKNLPYSEELVQHLSATLNLRTMLAQTELAEDQAKMMDMQIDQSQPAGQVGALPGTQPQPGMGPGFPPGDPPPDTGSQGAPPMSGSAGGDPMAGPGDMDAGGAEEPSRNRARPAESDEMRGGAPRAANKTAAARWAERIHSQGRDDDKHRPPSVFELGPSSAGQSRYATEDSVQAAVRRREMFSRHRGTPLVSQLVRDPDFYRTVNGGAYQNQIQSDYAEIRAGGAKESAELLRDLVDQYDDATGVRPVWD